MAGEDFPQGPHTPNEGADTPPVMDVVVEEVEGGSKKPWGLVAGAGALVVVLGGGLFALSGGETEIDTAQAEITEEVESTQEGTDPDVDTPTTTAAPEGSVTEASDIPTTTEGPREFVEEAMEDEAMAVDFGFGGGGTTNAIFDGEQFISLTNNYEAGWVLRTSVDGLDWVESPVSGIPEQGYINQLLFEDGTFAAIVDGYDEESGQVQSVITSADGAIWTAVDLPTSEDNQDAGLSGFAIIDGQAVVIRTIYGGGDDYVDPYELITEAGLLSESQIDMFCGFDFDYDNLDDPGPIDVLVCDYDEDFEYEEPNQAELDALAEAYENATTDEERDKILEASEELYNYGETTEVVATINPGDPIYDAIVESQTGDFGGENMTTEVLGGPLTGPFSIIGELPSDGYFNGVAQTSTALFVSFDSFDPETGDNTAAILTSTTGATWTEVGAPPSEFGGQLQGFGDTLLFTSYGFNGEAVNFVSNDNAQTWTESSLQSELFDTYSQFVAGEAGFVAITMGGLEPFDGGFEEPFGPDEGPVLEKEGFTLEVPWTSGDFTLTTPDGTVIEVAEDELYSGDSELVRENPINYNLTFLDPETGEDLVTFGDEDWEAAYGVFDEVYEDDFIEPEQGTEIHFSPDGITWTLLSDPAFDGLDYNSWVNPVGVGDDEAIFSITTYVEPDEELFAFEEEGREPTEAEIQAIEAFDGSGESTEFVRIELPV